VHAICTRYEPQYEVVSLRRPSGTDHLYNPSKPIPIPQVQADPIPQIQVAGNPKENRAAFEKIIGNANRLPIGNHLAWPSASTSGQEIT
jgi:hypothetical protein